MSYSRIGRIEPVWRVPTPVSGFTGRLRSRSAAVAWPLRLERYYLAFVMVLFNSMPFVVGGQSDSADAFNALKEITTASAQGDALKQVILLGLYAVSAVFVFTRVRPKVILSLGLPLLCLLGLCFASVAWSGAPSITIRRCIAVLGTVILAVHYAARFDLDRMLKMLSNTFFAILVISVIVAVVLPNRGLEIDGRYRGVFEGKNGMGAYAALTIVFFVSRMLGQPSRTLGGRLYRMAGVGLALVSLAWSLSAGPIPGLAFACASLVGARILRGMKGLSLALLPAVIAVAVVMLSLAVAILAGGEGAALLGRDPDLSGRTRVWAFVIKMILQHPFLGYGYQTFWEAGDQSSQAQVFWSIVKIAVRHSHDGYLQLTLDLGFIGLGLFITALAVMFRRLFWLVRNPETKSALWVVGLMAFYLLENIGETRVWVGNEILTFSLCYAATRVNIEYRIARARQLSVPRFSGQATINSYSFRQARRMRRLPL